MRASSRRASPREARFKRKGKSHASSPPAATGAPRIASHRRRAGFGDDPPQSARPAPDHQSASDNRRGDGRGAVASARSIMRSISLAPKRPGSGGRLAKVPRLVELALGATHPFPGRRASCDIRLRAGRRRYGSKKSAAGRFIRVSGRAEHAPRRLLDYLQARGAHGAGGAHGRTGGPASASGRRAFPCATRKAAGVRARRSVRCPFPGGSSSRRLFVLDYVVAHEVAHMRHMNHGPRFWKLVRELRRRFRQRPGLARPQRSAAASLCCAGARAERALRSR